MNYYARFIPDIATKLRPLYDCLEKQRSFLWTADCEKAFKEIKTHLISEKFLVHYDPNKPLIMTCDASPQGVSAVLLHRINKNEFPIHYASRTLNVSERNYSQLDREGLAIIFGVKTYFEYLFGQKFLLQTDSAALTRIFHPKKSIPAIAAARIQRCAVFLTAFRYEIKHIKGTENYADWLSRMPIKNTRGTEKEREFADEVSNVYFNYVKEYDLASFDWRSVQRATREDNIRCKIMRYCIDG